MTARRPTRAQLRGPTVASPEPEMSGRLDGRLVLLTGASAGIGRAAAVAFVAAGARVVGVSRSQNALEALSRELGGESHMVPAPADVADASSMEAMAARVLGDTGLPDVVVANAGIGLDARFAETSDDALRRVFEVNVFGLVRTVRPFLPGMIERESGRVLLISSIVGKRGIPSYSAYSASKFALHGMADALRTELQGSGVTVGLVCPSSTTSEFQQRMLREGPGQRRVRPRKHSAESVARAIVRMAGSRRRELILSPEAKLMAFVNCFAPGLLDKLLARMLNPKA
jgi:short-subunit dehydrogenase